MTFIIGFNACLFPCHVLIVSWLVLDFLAPWEGTIFLFCVCTASEAVMPWFFTNPGKCSSSTNGKQIWDANKSTFFSLIKHFFFLCDDLKWSCISLQLSWELPLSLPTSVTSLLFHSWPRSTWQAVCRVWKTIGCTILTWLCPNLEQAELAFGVARKCDLMCQVNCTYFLVAAVSNFCPLCLMERRRDCAGSSISAVPGKSQ